MNESKKKKHSHNHAKLCPTFKKLDMGVYAGGEQDYKSIPICLNCTEQEACLHEEWDNARLKKGGQKGDTL